MAVDPHIALLRAAGPGRVRGIALEIYGDALADPGAAGGILRRGLREARALHSAERRLVADGLYGLIRHEARLDLATGAPTPLARWLGWLVGRGLDPAAAADAWRAEVADAPVPTFERAVNLDALVLPEAPEAALAVYASVPIGVATELRRVFGDDARAFVDASALRAPVVLRVSGGQRDEAIRQLVAAGIEATPTRLAAAGVVVPTGTPVDGHPALRGLVWELQDEASQAVAELVDAPSGGRVLDLCAGAGGKALALVDRLPQVTVVATDVRAGALDALRHRAREAGVARAAPGRPGLTVQLLDDPGAPELGLFDAVLADVPCSGTGTLRRHPELRWRLDGLPELGVLQRELIRRAADHVAPGGQLVYATCSVLTVENEDVIAALLEERADFVLDPAAVPAPLRQGGFLRTAPHISGTDGLFAAVFRRRGPSTGEQGRG
jgi:16S rRNA (cytosine967-C5)-methyltransferase